MTAEQTLHEVARDLVAGVRENRARENLDRLYAPDAVSVEAVDMGEGREAHGLDAIRAKHDWWDANMEMLGFDVAGPFAFPPDRFAVHYAMKTRNRQTGEVGESSEVAVYHVQGGRIVREEFFYGGG
ncbi:MAG: nuclear transport factor 2 family protein [Rhodobacteraceae bacterium]|nr:nuclear transport factor 2 family protein [Paracoccaceae bacterium]